MGGSKREIAVAGGTLGAVVLGYVAVLGLAGPNDALAAPSAPVAPATPGPLLPAQGDFERAVQLAEQRTGGVTVQAEAENGNGVYEVKVILGNEEIKVLVDLKAENVTELEREVEDPFEDD